MSEREHNYGSGENSDGFVLGEPQAPQQNRPATGAAQVQSPHGLGHGWQGGSAATDFLGLDSDPRLDDGSSNMPLAAPLAGDLNAGGDSWLHSIEGSEAVPQTRAATQAPSNLFDAIEGQAFEDEDAPAAEEPVAPRAAQSSRPSRLWLFASAAVVLALLAGGAWMWRQRAHVPAVDPTNEVATNVTRTTPSKSKTPDRPKSNGKQPQNKTPAEPKANGTEQTPAVDPVATTTDTEPGPFDVATTPDQNGTEPAPIVTPTITFPPTTEPEAEAAPAVVAIPPATKTRSPFTTPPASDLPLPGALRRATEADFVGLWRETSIPKDAIDGPTRVRTLNVGRVRVLLVGGEYYEGTLYAVGEKRIWLDLELGRISFEASTVRDMVAIASASGTAANSKQKPEDLVGLPHVEVHMPGGIVTGRLVGRDGNRITLVTDKGLRTVLESDDVRPVTNRSTRVLGPVAKVDAEAAAADSKRP